MLVRYLAAGGCPNLKFIYLGLGLLLPDLVLFGQQAPDRRQVTICHLFRRTINGTF